MEHEPQEFPMQDLSTGKVFIGEEEISIAPEHMQFLGMSIQNLQSRLEYNSDKESIQALLGEFDTYCQETYGLYAMDYILLSHLYRYIGIIPLASEANIHHMALFRVFEKFNLPKASRSKIMELAQRKKREKRKEQQQEKLTEIQARDTSNIPLDYQLGSKHIHIKKEDQQYLGRRLDDLQEFLEPDFYVQLESTDLMIRKLYNISLIDHMFLSYHYLDMPLETLATTLHCSTGAIRKLFTLQGLSWTHRAAKLKEMEEKKRGIFSQDKETLRRNAIKAGQTTYERRRGIFAMSREQKQAQGRYLYEHGIGFHKRTPHERRMHSARLGRTYGYLGIQKQMQEKIGLFGLTPRQHYLAGIKGRELKGGREPSKVDKIIIELLDTIDPSLYAREASVANEGQVFYADYKNNRRMIRLADNRVKIPDFKIKGKKKVIEVYRTHFNSRNYVEKAYSTPADQIDYLYKPERMIEEYAKVGYDCLVLLEEELKDPTKEADVKKRIRQFLAEK